MVAEWLRGRLQLCVNVCSSHTHTSNLKGCGMYHVKKINKRLIIVDDADQTIYSMPGWVQIPHRACMQELADKFNELGSNDIVAIMEFESRYSTVRKRNPR